MVNFAGRFGIPTPANPEIRYGRALRNFIRGVFGRQTKDLDADILDLEDEAIEHMGRWLVQVDEYNASAVRESFRKNFGDDSDRLIRDAMSGNAETVIAERRVRNVSLIKDIGPQNRRLLVDALQTLEDEPLNRRVQKILGIGENRAKLIARDQTNKYNSSLSQVRHLAAGATNYKWVTSADERVRDLHAGLNGRKFTYGLPTTAEGGGAPGEPIQCRCIADPIFDD